MKLTSFKNIGYFFTGILFLAVFLVSSSKPYNLTEAVITLNNLSSRNHLSIEKDFNKMRGVDFCDVSLITNSLTLQINDDIYWNMSTPIIASGFPKSTMDKMKELLRNSDPTDTSPRGRRARAALLKHKSWLSYNEGRLRIKVMWEEFFTSFDVLICPVVFTTAFDHNHEPDMYNRTITIDGVDRKYFELTVWPSVATLPQLPSVAIPIGHNAEGLPIGVQVIGPYLEDYTPIAFAQAIEGVCSGYTPPSIVQ